MCWTEMSTLWVSASPWPVRSSLISVYLVPATLHTPLQTWGQIFIAKQEVIHEPKVKVGIDSREESTL